MTCLPKTLELGLLPIFFGGFFEAIDGLEIKHFDMSKFRTDFPTNVSNTAHSALQVNVG